jgi:hypothetical protein
MNACWTRSIFSRAVTDFILLITSLSMIMLPVASNLLTNLFIVDLLGAFLHSEFVLNCDNSSSVVKYFH